MKRRSTILVAVFTIALGGQATAASLDSRVQADPILDFYTAWQVVWMYDQEKLARDINLRFYQIWGKQIFAGIAESETRHMDELMTMIHLYELNLLTDNDATGVYGDDRHTEKFAELTDQGQLSLLEAYRASAYLEEWDIKEFSADIQDTVEQPLLDTYARLLAGASNHLRTIVSHITALGDDYQAQLLTQSDVDLICSAVGPEPGTGFAINAQLNDAWYYPGTDGQGFFITVYPDSKVVFVAWLTYDTDLPPAGAASKLGSAGQRWLTAHGNFVGGQANLTVYSCSGGLFDSGSPKPQEQAIGTMLLQFEDCTSGSVYYDLPAIDRSGTIPIRRIMTENVAQCELVNQPGG